MDISVHPEKLIALILNGKISNIFCHRMIIIDDLDLEGREVHRAGVGVDGVERADAGLGEGDAGERRGGILRGDRDGQRAGGWHG